MPYFGDAIQIQTDKARPFYQMYKYEMTIFFPKKHVKFGRMIKKALFKVYSIASYTFFPSFGQLVDTTPVKIFHFCREPFIEPFFHIFVRTKALLSKCVTIDANKW